MSAYYREHVIYPSVASGPYSDSVAGTIPEVGAASPTDDAAQDGPPVRVCSVKGCGTLLQPDYALKMCEACRGRHRIYANTKRQKRKQEKAAMGAQNGQPVVWMPPDDTADEDDENGAKDRRQRLAPTASVAPLSNNDAGPTFPGASASWEHNAIDPRLFSPLYSQTSELAGALTLPTSASQSPRIASDVQLEAQHNVFAQASAMLEASGSPNSPLDGPDYNPTSNDGSTSADNAPKAVGLPITDSILDGSLPPRYCSIKGCKALVSGHSFFKMCEPCRDRYRNYGTTKRAKWKREKEVAVAELHKVREEEEKRRADAGLPPLSDLPDTNTANEWHEYQADDSITPQALTSVSTAPPEDIERPARMCTVSHCREILPGDYQYLRCERHRIQNRHHSKLKRVRDKESKAMAFDEWAAAASTRSGDDREFSRDASDESGPEADFGLGGVGAVAGVGEDTPFGEPSTGVPPAARGTRRTNHVCSIKACYNLLSPSNPWKMCDSCRARDRAIRRWKALRDSGVITEPPPGLVLREGRGVKKPKKKKKKAKEEDADSNPGEQSSSPSSASGSKLPDSSLFTTAPTVARSTRAPNAETDVMSSNQASMSGANLIFMEPLLPTEAEDIAAVITTEGLQSAPSNGNAVNGASASANPAAQGAPNEPAPTARKKKPTKRKEKAPKSANENVPNMPTGTEASTSTLAGDGATALQANGGPAVQDQSGSGGVPETLSSASVIQPSASPEAAMNGAYMQPQYHMPYYVPTPYGMQPYPPGPHSPRYPYSPPYGYSRGPYPPGPMYQSPYPPYLPPYYPPQPYAQSYAPQSYTTPQPQPMYSVSSTFVSRAEYTASQNSQAPYGPPDPASYSYNTFSARTGEPHHRASHTPSQPRRKRLHDQSSPEGEPGTNKRQEVGMADENIGSTDAALASVDRSPGESTPVYDSAAAAGETHGAPGTIEQLKESCSSKNCHRTLPQNASGTVCARCKERQKKRQIKAKQRFKLEPRKSLTRPVNIGPASDGEGRDMEAERVLAG